MGLFLIIELVLIAIACGLIYLFYWIPKTIGYPKVGKYLSIFVGLSFCVVTFMTVFEDQLFSKKDARELLEEQDIHLLDSFDIIENKSNSVINNYYHTFVLRISAKDKARIIKRNQELEKFPFRQRGQDLF
jgi:hypothetical protein